MEMERIFICVNNYKEMDILRDVFKDFHISGIPSEDYARPGIIKIENSTIVGFSVFWPEEYVYNSVYDYLSEKSLKGKEKGIIIKASRTISMGKCGYRIEYVKALPEDNLPIEYYSTRPYVIYLKRWVGANALLLRVNELVKYVIFSEQFYTRTEFRKIIGYLREAGDNLRRINKNIRRTREEDLEREEKSITIKI